MPVTQPEVNEKNEKGILKFFQEKVKKSGHSLENRVEDLLHKDRFSIDREVPYIDKDESKGRNIDLIARAEIPESYQPKSKEKYIVGQINLIIECKNLPDHGWIFFKGKDPDLVLPDKVTIGNYMPIEIVEADPTRYYTPIKPIPNLFSASGYDEYILDNKNANNHVNNS